MCKGDLFDWSMYKYYTIMRLNENKVIDMMFPVHFWVSKTVLKQKASSPVSVQYLVQILRGWKKKKKMNRENIALVREQLESADNVEHYFRGWTTLPEAWDWKLKVTTEMILVLFLQQKLPRGPKHFIFLLLHQKHQFIPTQDSNCAAVPSVTSTMHFVIANTEIHNTLKSRNKIQDI